MTTMHALGRLARGLALVLAMSVTSAAVQAEESDTDEPQQRPVPAEATKPATETAPSPDIFIPSEEISEDFAVPFPVDI